MKKALTVQRFSPGVSLCTSPRPLQIHSWPPSPSHLSFLFPSQARSLGVICGNFFLSFTERGVLNLTHLEVSRFLLVSCFALCNSVLFWVTFLSSCFHLSPIVTLSLLSRAPLSWGESRKPCRRTAVLISTLTSFLLRRREYTMTAGSWLMS